MAALPPETGFCEHCWHALGFHADDGGCGFPFRGGCPCPATRAGSLPDEEGG